MKRDVRCGCDVMRCGCDVMHDDTQKRIPEEMLKRRALKEDMKSLQLFFHLVFV
jgi:hypothetical protein